MCVCVCVYRRIAVFYIILYEMSSQFHPIYPAFLIYRVLGGNNNNKNKTRNKNTAQAAKEEENKKKRRLLYVM